jgi:hypothetical protein
MRAERGVTGTCGRCGEQFHSLAVGKVSSAAAGVTPVCWESQDARLSSRRVSNGDRAVANVMPVSWETPGVQRWLRCGGVGFSYLIKESKSEKREERLIIVRTVEATDDRQVQLWVRN